MKNILVIILFTFHSLTFSVVTQTLHPPGSSKRIALTFAACMTGSMVKKLEAGTEKSLDNAAIIEKEADIQKAQVVLIQLTGKKPKLILFPGGCYHAADQALVNHLGLKVVGRTFTSGDAFNSGTDAIIKNVLTKAKSGAIVVFHLMGGRHAPKTPEVIKIIIPALRQKGYNFVTVSNCISGGYPLKALC